VFKLTLLQLQLIAFHIYCTCFPKLL